MLRVEKIKHFRGNEKLKSLYREAFPDGERLPEWLLTLLSRKNGIDFLGFYDNGNLCGICYLISKQSLTFVLYLAVDSSIRSKGYGSQILQWIKENRTGTVVLNIDTVREHAPDYEQRLSRKRFYERNGFRDTGDQLRDSDCVFDILACGDGYNKETYTELLKSYFHSFYRFSIETV